MTDPYFTAEQREIIETMFHHTSVGEFLEGMSHYVRDPEALLPTPPRPTLADMTVEERRACRWMQADTETWGRAVILLPNEGGGRAVTLDQWGHVAYEVRDRITPRPDLPRMTWPGTGQGADTSDAVPPNTLAEGSVWDNVDALARACEESGRDQIVVADKDGDVFVWGVDAEWWETGLPGCDYAPHTIIHAGKKADL